MPKSSKVTGTKPKTSKSIPINDQVIKKIKDVEKNLSIHFGLNKVKYLLREKIEIERLVTYPIPSASYELKTEIIELKTLQSYKDSVDENKLITFKNKVKDFLDEHPPTSRDSVESYISKHGYYLPIEFAYLMRHKGEIDIENSSLNDIEDSIHGILNIDNMLDDLINSECSKQKIDNRQLTIEKHKYSPKLVWQGNYKNFSGFILSIINNGWIEMPNKFHENNAKYFVYHFEIIEGGKEVRTETLAKALGTFNKLFIGKPDIIQEKRDKKDFPFAPLDLPVLIK